jgi:hypothetical protein
MTRRAGMSAVRDVAASTQEMADAVVHLITGGGIMPQRLHLQPGYTVDLAHLQHRVTLAEDLTPGALCESLKRMAPHQRVALKAILGTP